MSDPKEDKVEQTEQSVGEAEEQTANPVAVEDEQSVEDEVADLDVDEDEEEYTEDPEEEIEDEDEDENYEPDPDEPEAA